MARAPVPTALGSSRIPWQAAQQPSPLHIAGSEFQLRDCIRDCSAKRRELSSKVQKTLLRNNRISAIQVGGNPRKVFARRESPAKVIAPSNLSRIQLNQARPISGLFLLPPRSTSVIDAILSPTILFSLAAGGLYSADAGSREPRCCCRGSLSRQFSAVGLFLLFGT